MSKCIHETAGTVYCTTCGGDIPTADTLARNYNAMRLRAEAAEQRVTDLTEGLRAIISSPVEFEDERVSYVAMQVSRADLEHVRALLEQP